MTIGIQETGSVRGSALLATLCAASVICLALASYLSLVLAQQTSVARSQAWNAALGMAEAGVEEGLAQLNGNSTFSANGWGGSGGTFGPISRTLADGSYSV